MLCHPVWPSDSSSNLWLAKLLLPEEDQSMEHLSLTRSLKSWSRQWLIWASATLAEKFSTMALPENVLLLIFLWESSITRSFTTWLWTRFTQGQEGKFRCWPDNPLRDEPEVVDYASAKWNVTAWSDMGLLCSFEIDSSKNPTSTCFIYVKTVAILPTMTLDNVGIFAEFAKTKLRFHQFMFPTLSNCFYKN